MDSSFLTEESFLTKIDEIVQKEGLNYIEAIIHFCEDNNVDVEDVKSVIGKSLIDRLKVDATEYGYFKKQAKLPI
jgi:hypothetical protein